MNQAPIIQPGEKAKNFSLKDHEDRMFGLYEHMGRRILLSFHPLAWTPVCAAQMKSLEENRERFEQLNTVAVGLSVDSVPCKKAWAGTLGITHTPLLCDFWPHGYVAGLYGLFRDANGFSERANVIVDERLNVAFVKVYPLHLVPDIAEVIRFIEGLEKR